MNFIDFFSGIGGFHKGLENAGMKCVGWCEADKFAQRSYRAIHDVEGVWFSDDITKVKGQKLPDADVWTAGFPCQDISVAGLRKGITNGKRSSLFFEVVRLLDEVKNKPKYIIFENVRNLLSIEQGGAMLKLLNSLDDAGFDAEWKVYNSKDYGVPQNRQRVYIVGRNRAIRRHEVLPVPRESTAAIQQIGNLIDTTSFGGNPQRGRVYSLEGVSPTLNTSGDTQPKIAFIDAIKGRPLPAEIARTLTSRYDSELSNRNGKKSYISKIFIDENGAVNFAKPLSIRKLTPRECFRLQGFTDDDFNKAQAVNSNSQLYKQAGNAVTVNVVQAIGESIMGIERRFYNA